MGLTRKKYIIDKKFQISLSLRAILLPLLTIIIMFGVLLFFANRNNIKIDNNNKIISENNNHILNIIDNHINMIEIFLSTPNLLYSNDPGIKQSNKIFKNNIGMLKKIKNNSKIIINNGMIISKNSYFVFYFLIMLAIIQIIIIFLFHIFISHKISGPVHVMSRHLKDIKKGNTPVFRPLRKKDELLAFYKEFRETIEHITNNKDIKKDKD
jgi:methyl-accepting chemotaxis protein